jgi:hypothetical protein
MATTKKKKLDMNAVPEMPAASPFAFREPPAPVTIESKLPVCNDPLIDLLLVAVRAGLRVQFSWGVEGAFVPDARNKLHISFVPSPNSPHFQRTTRYQVWDEIVDLTVDNVVATVKRLLDSLPSVEPVKVVRPPDDKKPVRLE